MAPDSMKGTAEIVPLSVHATALNDYLPLTVLVATVSGLVISVVTLLTEFFVHIAVAAEGGGGGWVHGGADAFVDAVAVTTVSVHLIPVVALFRTAVGIV